ncbi:MULTISPECIES: hypothetical protein [unclassified Stenotrophomonas]|uniref:hypothetical protein n=1 Tax=unclassified Stenotrophomonas TaxID=196198 RepID=UPI00244C3514|nr:MULTISPECIES: hypothetical protein [unclassified Stenotrophomonas]MDG9842407.1 hypothetical protein [Stenotrophomonas sp. GD04054]MDH0016298.1 hypothetical protein [Stenotrophomonas sp. GD04028]MDH0575233.1 hypothetical protein [Stenotrophomonas sp. GD03997]MDH0860273.1 hypothetical protein [Stenotrophomonas sp. GD03882]
MPLIADPTRPYRYLSLLLVLCLTVAALLGLGFATGHRWAAGSAAIEQREGLELQLRQLQQSAKTLQTQSAQATANYYRATQRLNHIAELQELDRENQRQFNLQQQEALASLLRNRPDLRTGRAGADVLQHWNRSNAGAAPPAARPADAGSAQGRVPGAASSQGRSLGNPAGESRPGRGAVPRLPQPAAKADAGSVGLGGDRLGLVLHSGHPAAVARGGLCP